MPNANKIKSILHMKSKLPPSPPSIFSKMSALARQHQAINLGQGFPDFDCDSRLKTLIKKYLDEGHNQYCPMAGTIELRTTIADKIKVCYDKTIDPEKEICITAGATQALNTAIQTFVQSEDEVIIIEPAYDSYRPSIEMAGGRVVAYRITAPDYAIDWDQFGELISERTTMIIINTPHNPTGTTLQEADLLALQTLIANKDIVLLSDEVYEHLIYDQAQHQSIFRYPQLYQQSLATFSFGKTLHATGWKLGYIVGPPHLMEAYKNHHQWVIFSANSFVQRGIGEYLQEPTTYQNLPDFFQKKRDYLTAGMSHTNFKPLNCGGTYFQLYDYSEVSNLGDLEFAEYMTKEMGVASIPLSPFYGKDPQDKVIRLCFAKSEEVLDKAIERLSIKG